MEVNTYTYRQIYLLTNIEKIYPLILLVFDPSFGIATPNDKDRPYQSTGMAYSRDRQFAGGEHCSGGEVMTVQSEQVVSHRFAHQTSKYKEVAGLGWDWR
jgi:hypothetical protein